MSFQIKIFKGPEILSYIETLADMRLEAFFEYPYLYVGKREDELSYVKSYALSPQGLLIVAFKNEKIAGICSGIPLNFENSPLKPWHKKLEKEGLEIEMLYYGGEIIVKPQFQKQKACFLLMTQFIEAVKEMKFSKIIGITCIRAKDHPLCPPKYFGPESIWEKMGGEKTNIILSSHWSTRQENGSLKKQKNNLAVWIKRLN
ncbi:MAG: hypothetical protein B7Y25_05090 [Alphaproteobacteria bacterium 16-39-46]|nr:MAG: hypothetical protein B7Y25_05090 [Alphaproteobacteria bacterium 16-39-46]OZA42769.1 MAG: hypothetical protein B7X84_05000 [Alphaproteobacteria bacterium 17-39-52]HQS84307.1 GNAT family N-acetyltransferase [Alphaproteobacteria bacterium]HQS94143.1 GNAT family N-acetyltransferase [Alphaproteobacteria bacterium]